MFSARRRHGGISGGVGVLFTVMLAIPVCLVVSFPESGYPLETSETLFYHVTWTGIKAGEVSLEAKRSEDRLMINARALSAPWVSVFFRVDDTAESTLVRKVSETTIGQPVVFTLNFREGRNRRHREVRFDGDKRTAVTIDHLKGEKKQISIPPAVFDPLGGLYHLRRMSLGVGRSSHIPILDGRKVSNVEVRVLRKEKVRVPAGEFSTIVVQPLVKSEGLFFRRGEIYIWLSDDERHIPVKVKTKVRLGFVTALLVKVVP